MKGITNRVTTGQRQKLPVFHPLATKLAAIKEVNTLVNSGLSLSKARRTVAKGLHVHATTVENWLRKHGITTTAATVQTNGSANNFSINSLTVKTDSGIVKLTPSDIRNIAGLARFF